MQFLALVRGLNHHFGGSSLGRGRIRHQPKNSEYLDFSDHLGHGLTENKRQNLYTFGERTRAAQPGLLNKN